MEVITFLEAFFVGFLIFTVVANDRSPVRRRLPNFRIKKIQLFPTIRVHTSGRIIWFHHWLTFSIILFASFFITGGVLGFIFTKGFLLGGIVQGLTLKKTRHIVHKHPKVY